jgi:solute carrier family 50 (sugar transporter)
MTSAKWVSTIFCPLLGLILANLMWLSPFTAILNARKMRELGSINPIPFIAMITNCFGWTFYACFTNDQFLFWANSFGIILGLFYAITCLTLLSKKTADEEYSELYLQTERGLLFAVFFWSVMGLLCSQLFSNFSDPIRQCAMMTGLLSCCFSIGYYAAPLTTVFQVISNRDASSLYFPTILVNLINALSWFFYGLLGTHDLLLWIPNGLGFILATIQISLIIMFKKQSLWNTLLGRTANMNRNPTTEQNYQFPSHNNNNASCDDGDDDGEVIPDDDNHMEGAFDSSYRVKNPMF